jgi:hypothetical protein
MDNLIVHGGGLIKRVCLLTADWPLLKEALETCLAPARGMAADEDTVLDTSPLVERLLQLYMRIRGRDVVKTLVGEMKQSAKVNSHRGKLAAAGAAAAEKRKSGNLKDQVAPSTGPMPPMASSSSSSSLSSSPSSSIPLSPSLSLLDGGDDGLDDDNFSAFSLDDDSFSAFSLDVSEAADDFIASRFACGEGEDDDEEETREDQDEALVLDVGLFGIGDAKAACFSS